MDDRYPAGSNGPPRSGRMSLATPQPSFPAPTTRTPNSFRDMEMNHSSGFRESASLGSADPESAGTHRNTSQVLTGSRNLPLNGDTPNSSINATGLRKNIGTSVGEASGRIESERTDMAGAARFIGSGGGYGLSESRESRRETIGNERPVSSGAQSMSRSSSEKLNASSSSRITPVLPSSVKVGSTPRASLSFDRSLVRETPARVTPDNPSAEPRYNAYGSPPSTHASPLSASRREAEPKRTLSSPDGQEPPQSKYDAAQRWLSSADRVLIPSKQLGPPPQSSSSSTSSASALKHRLYQLDDSKQFTPSATTPGPTVSRSAVANSFGSTKRGLQETIAELHTDDEDDQDVSQGRRTHNPKEYKDSSIASSRGDRDSVIMETPGTDRLNSNRFAASSLPKTSIFDEDPVDDDSASLNRTAAERKAERFLNAAGTVLTEDKILEQDPRALPGTGCRVLFRSCRGSYLRKARDSNRAMTGGTPFDFSSCEFILEKQSHTPSKILMYGDSVFLRMAQASGPRLGKTGGLYLSGTEFTRDSRGTWTIRRYVGPSTTTTTKPQTETSSSGTEESTVPDYIRSSDAIVLEYDSNHRVLGAPSVPHDAEGSSYVTLEISPLEQSQCWHLVRVQGVATSYVPSASTTISSFMRTENVFVDPERESISASVYLLETLMGLYSPSTSLERLIKSDDDLLLLERCSGIQKQIKFLRDYVFTHKELEWGRVVQAFCFHLEEKVLDAFDEFLADLLNSPKVASMTFVVNAIQPRSRVPGDWARALEQIQYMRGGMFLNALNGLKLGTFENRSTCEEALASALQPYLESLRRWVVSGEVFDPFDEFFIVENLKITQQQLAVDYNAKYWNAKFSLREEKHIPWFLRKHAEMLLRTGRDLQAARSGSLNTDRRSSSSSQTFNNNNNNRTTQPMTSSLSLLLKAFSQPTTAFLKQPQLGETLLVECHKRASAQLLNVLRQTKLMRRLDLVKKFFLLERGDFFLYFMDVAGEELRSPTGGGAGGTTTTATKSIATSVRGENQQHRLSTLLQVAMREREISSSQTLLHGEEALDSGGDDVVEEFLNDLSCVLLPYAVDTHVETIHQRASETTTNDRGGGELHPLDSSEIVGLEDALLCVDAVALEYSPPWPSSLILTKRVMTKYQLLFRHLFRCKHAERRICASWVAVRRRGMNDVTAQNLILRMTHFLQSLEYYTAFEVIEPRWRDFIAKAKNALEIDDLLRAHEDFLDSCLRDCLLTNPTLIRGLSRLLRLCLSLGDLLLPDDGSRDWSHEQAIPVRCDPIRVSEFDRELSDFLSSLYGEGEKGQFRTEHLHNLAIRLDFSGFYGVTG